MNYIPLNHLEKTIYITVPSHCYKSEPYIEKDIDTHTDTDIDRYKIECVIKDNSIDPVDILNVTIARTYKKDSFTITEHAFKRGRERLGLTRKTLPRIANKALTKGVLVNNYSDYIRQRLMPSGYKYSKDVLLYLYGQHIFVFSIQYVLITIVPVRDRQCISLIKQMEKDNEKG